MNEFKVQRKVLLVENEWTEIGQFLEDAGYYVKIAKNSSSAIDLLRNELFHIALVDLELEGGPRGNYYGLEEVLPEINNNFPDCYRLIFTGHAQDRPIDIIKSLSVPNMIAHGCYIKEADSIGSITSFLDSMWNSYIRINDNLSVIPCNFNLDELLNERFYSRKASLGQLNILKETFLSVVSRLFYGNHEIEELAIELFKPGFSKTILLKATAKSTLLKNRPGKQVIIKFGQKELISGEADNFDKYVQWYLNQNQTMQKLAFSSFNNYAAMLFTYAGDSPENIFTFADYIREELIIKEKKPETNFDVVANQCILNMFNPSITTREWYNLDVIETGNKVIQDYYIDFVLKHKPFKLDNEFFKKQILISRKSNITLKDQEKKLLFTDINREIYNPLYFCNKAHFLDNYSTCIIHGDLNGKNIILSSDGKWYLIDYAYTGRGHVFQDFINLELSIRNTIFWESNISFSFKDISDFEDSLLNSYRLKEQWGKIDCSTFIQEHYDYNKENQDNLKTKYLAKSAHLICLLRQQAVLNFPDEPQKLYLVGLFYMSLDWLTYHIKIEQKRHMIFLAGLLAESLSIP